jgi:HAD superfamily hydrolase (TIGR01509 family)
LAKPSQPLPSKPAPTKYAATLPVTSQSVRIGAERPEAVIFDIGRVIIRINLKRALASLTGFIKDADAAPVYVKASADQIWASIENDPLWHDWQEGRVTPQRWHEQITRRLNLPLAFDEFCKAWNLALDPELILPDTLLEQLGASCRLALLSNTDTLHSEYIERHFPFIRHFPVRVYSCRIGSSKPSAAIYEETLRRLGVPATAALYIDDVAEFAGAARRMGMDAICFEDPAQLGQELRLRGLFVD